MTPEEFLELEKLKPKIVRNEKKNYNLVEFLKNKVSLTKLNS